MALLCELTRFASTAITKHMQICSRMALVPCEPIRMRNGTPSLCIRSKCYTLEGNGFKKDKSKRHKTKSRSSPNSSQIPQQFTSSFKSNGKIFHIDISKLNNILQQTGKTLQNLASAKHQSREGIKANKTNFAQHTRKPSSAVNQSSNQRPVNREKESSEAACHRYNKGESAKKTNLKQPTPVFGSQMTNAGNKTATKPLKSENRPNTLKEAIEELNKSVSKKTDTEKFKLERNTKADDILEIKPTVVEVIGGPSKNVSKPAEECIPSEPSGLQKQCGVIRGANFILVDENSPNAPLKSLNASKIVTRRNIDSGPVLTDSTDHVAYGDRNTFILVDSMEQRMARRYGKDKNNFVINNDNPHVVIKPSESKAKRNTCNKCETKNDGEKINRATSKVDVQTKDIHTKTKDVHAGSKNAESKISDDVSQRCHKHDVIKSSQQNSANLKPEKNVSKKEPVGHQIRKAVHNTDTQKAAAVNNLKTINKNEKSFPRTTDDDSPVTSFECVIRDSQKLIEKIENDKLKQRRETSHLEGDQSIRNNGVKGYISDKNKVLLSKEPTVNVVSKAMPSKESSPNITNKVTSSKESSPKITNKSMPFEESGPNFTNKSIPSKEPSPNITNKSIPSKEPSPNITNKSMLSKESGLNITNRSMPSKESGATNYILSNELSARPEVMNDGTSKAPKFPKASVKELKPDVKRARHTENEHSSDILRKKEDREPPLYVRPEELNKRTFPQSIKKDGEANPETLKKSCNELTDIELWSQMLLQEMTDYQKLTDKPIRVAKNTRPSLVSNASEASKSTSMNRISLSPPNVQKKVGNETVNSKLSKNITEVKKMPPFDINNLRYIEELKQVTQCQPTHDLKNQRKNQKTLDFNCTGIDHKEADKRKVKTKQTPANFLGKNKSDTCIATCEGLKRKSVSKSGSTTLANLNTEESKKSSKENTEKKNKKLGDTYTIEPVSDTYTIEPVSDTYTIEPVSKWTKLRQAIFNEDSAQPKLADKQIKSSSHTMKDLKGGTGQPTLTKCQNKIFQNSCTPEKILMSQSTSSKVTPKESQQPSAGSAPSKKVDDVDIDSSVAYKEFKSNTVTKSDGSPVDLVLPTHGYTVGDLREVQALRTKAEKGARLVEKQTLSKDEPAVRKSSSNFDLKTDLPLSSKSVRSLSNLRSQDKTGDLSKADEKVAADIQLGNVKQYDGANIIGANLALRKFQNKLEKQKKLINNYEKNLMKYELALEKYRSLLTPEQKSAYDKFREGKRGKLNK